MFARKNQYSHKSPGIPATSRIIFAFLGLLLTFAGCGGSGSKSYYPGDLFTREPLDGEERIRKRK